MTRGGRRPATDDRASVERWIEDNPPVGARLTAIDDPYEPPEPPERRHEILIVTVADPVELRRARSELSRVVRSPERLRFRRWRPPAAEVERALQWVMTTQPPPGGSRTGVAAAGEDPASGLVAITLDRIDPAYAAELETATDGLAFVLAEPETPEAPVAYDAEPGGGRS